MSAKQKKFIRELLEIPGADKWDSALLGCGLSPAQIIEIPKPARKRLVENLNMALRMAVATDPNVSSKERNSALESADERLLGKVPTNTVNVNLEVPAKAMSDDEIYTRLAELARESPKLVELLNERGIQLAPGGTRAKGGSPKAGNGSPDLQPGGVADR